MGLASSAHYNSRETNANYALRAAAIVQFVPEQVAKHEAFLAGAPGYVARPNYQVLATCGHIIEAISGFRPQDAKKWEDKIAAGKPPRRRCWNCPK